MTGLRKSRRTAVGCWLLAVGCWLLAAGCWLLAAGCWNELASGDQGRLVSITSGSTCYTGNSQKTDYFYSRSLPTITTSWPGERQDRASNNNVDRRLTSSQARREGAVFVSRQLKEADAGQGLSLSGKRTLCMALLVQHLVR